MTEPVEGDEHGSQPAGRDLKRPVPGPRQCSATLRLSSDAPALFRQSVGPSKLQPRLIALFDIRRRQ